MATRKLRVFSDADVALIADTYHNWRTKGKKYDDVDGFCKAAPISDVVRQDYKLTPGIYVGTEAEEDDGVPFEEKMEGLKDLLIWQFIKSEEIKNKILERLNCLQ